MVSKVVFGSLENNTGCFPPLHGDNMRVIFNHLLFRMLGQAVERIQVLQRERELIERWTKGDKEEKERLSKQAEYGINTLLRSKDVIYTILAALEESKPIEMNPEQDILIEIVRKTFKRGLIEYQSLIKYAVKVGFDKTILEGLEKNKKLSDANTEEREDKK